MIALAALLGLVQEDARFLRRTFDGLQAEYLVVAPPEFVGALEDLCAHRSREYSVVLVRTDDVAAKFGEGAEGIAKLVEAVRPRYLLLAGDVDRVPTSTRKGGYTSAKFPSDEDLSTDHLFGTVAGRFPADTVEELRAMVAKTVGYETRGQAGRWQKKIAFVTGEGGFGAMVDTLLERQFSSVVANDIPPAYDVEVAYAKPSSRYCYYPPKFEENALRLLNEGALFYAYVGHGMRTAFDDVSYKGRFYPIFEEKAAGRVEAGAGLPIMVIIACNTGEFDSPQGDCIGEALFKRPRGPVAFIGGSRITQPYANTLFGHKLVERVFRTKARTIGLALQGAREDVLGDDASGIRKSADLLAAVVQGPDSLRPMREDVVLHYNLLGDPALVIRRPTEELELDTLGILAPGRKILVTGRAASGPVEVTLECPRNRFCHPTDLQGADVEKAILRRYENANNKVIRRAEAAVEEERFEVELELPAKPGKYFIKAYATGVVGAKAIEVTE
jgi:hypothetical protein